MSHEAKLVKWNCHFAQSYIIKIPGHSTLYYNTDIQRMTLTSCYTPATGAVFLVDIKCPDCKGENSETTVYRQTW
jgi:hypothetical protein